MSMMHDQSNIR